MKHFLFSFAFFLLAISAPFLISKALQDIMKRDNGNSANFISIDPFPREFFKTNIPLLDTIIEKPVQQVAISLFKNLSANDILFIDSTHVMKYGSDVEYEIFNILPMLQKGVIIHFHDIFLKRQLCEINHPL